VRHKRLLVHDSSAASKSKAGENRGADQDRDIFGLLDWIFTRAGLFRLPHKGREEDILIFWVICMPTKE
jgi:hypothetical protein